MTQSNTVLGICIPTYNRRDMLVECLHDTISKVRAYNLPIVVTDNASDDGTREAVEAFVSDYPYLTYHRQRTNIGADRNFESCLKLSSAEYSWLLGDSYRIEQSEIENMLQLLGGQQYCLFLHNALGRVKRNPSCVYNSPDKLLRDLGWHMTMMASLVIRRDLIETADFERYYDTNFIQNGIIFDYMTRHADSAVYWYDRSCCTSTTMKKVSWLDQRWDIFGIGWTNYVFSLPAAVTVPSKERCIRMHNDRMQLFTVSKTITLRLNDKFDLETLNRARPYLRYFWGIPYAVPYLIAVAPKWLLRTVPALRKIIKKLKNRT